LSWREQVSRVVSRTYSTLRLIYRFQRYTSRDLRIYLVRSLIIPIFSVYGCCVFSFACGVGVFDLRRFDHISEFSRDILGYTLFEYLELRLAYFIHKIGLILL
jgi:hypothetical protein